MTGKFIERLEGEIAFLRAEIGTKNLDGSINAI